MTFIQWVIDNWEAIVTVIIGLHGAALAVTNLTPTPRDDEIVGKVYKFVEALAGIGDKAKLKPGEVPRK